MRGSDREEAFGEPTLGSMKLTSTRLSGKLVSARHPIGRVSNMNQITLAEVIALAAVVLSIGTNVGLYIHLSSTMSTRFDSIERRLELMQGALHDLDVRITKLEPR
jgi:hypothetical protein